MRLPRRLLVSAAALTAAALFGSGYVAGQHHRLSVTTAAPAAQPLGTDFCEYRVRTEYFAGGSYTYVSGVVAEYDRYSRRWNSVSEYTARGAISSVFCERGY